MVTRTMFVIAVPDLAASAAYYRDTLGFTVEKVEDGSQFYFYRLGACTIFAGACPDAPHPSTIGDHSYFAYLVVDDVDAFHDRVRGNGATITKPPRTEPWGMRELGLRTIDGHRIMIASEVRDTASKNRKAPKRG